MRRCLPRIAAGLLAALGMLQLGQAGWIEAKAWLAVGLIESAWQATLANGSPTRPWPWADTWPVAKLSAIGQDVDLIVLAGTLDRLRAAREQ